MAQRELLLALTTRWLGHLIPLGNALRDLSVCRDATYPHALQRGSVCWKDGQQSRAAEPGTHLCFLTVCAFPHRFMGLSPKTFSLFIFFFSEQLSLSPPQACFLFRFLFFFLSCGEPAKLSILQCYEMGKATVHWSQF